MFSFYRSSARSLKRLRDLAGPKWMYLKAALLLMGGVLSAGLVWLDNPTLRTAALLCLAVWCFARAYYFAFYVIEHYVDPTFRFSGLGSFLLHLTRRRLR
jgi:hypothetical protein